MFVDSKMITIAEFEAFANLPENHARRFELINGEIIQKMPSNLLASWLAARFGFLLNLFLSQSKTKGFITGADGGFVIDGNVFAPDVAYTTERLSPRGFGQTPPLLAVEVLSDPNNSQEQAELRRKMIHYMQAGVILWVADYISQTIQVIEPGKPAQMLTIKETLTAETILPGFSVPIAEIFQLEDEA